MAPKLYLKETCDCIKFNDNMFSAQRSGLLKT